MVIPKNKFSSLNHIQKIIKVFCVIFKEQNLWVVVKKSSILGVILDKKVEFWKTCEKGINSSSNFQKKKLSHISKKKVQILESFQKISILWVTQKKVSILWVIFKKKKLNSLSLIFVGKKSILRVELKTGSILWVVSNKRVQFFESYQKKVFNSLSQIRKRVQSFPIKKVPFLDSYFKKKFNSLSHIWKNVQFFASYSKKKGSILRVVIKKGSILWIILQKSSNFWF